MSRSFDRLVVTAFRGRSAADLAAAPPDALYGLSAADASRLYESFRTRTVSQLATNRLFGAASAIHSAATGTPAYDPGPPPVWEQAFGSAPLPTFTSRPDLFRIDFGPVYYRGRLDGTARVLVVGQDPSVNEILAQRAFVGRSGQRLQGLLAKVGLTRSYVMLNTFLMSIFDQFGGDNARLSRQDPILGHRNALFDLVAATSPVEVILTVGSAARDAVDRWPAAANFPRVHILHPAFPDTAALLANWNLALESLCAAVGPDDGKTRGTPYGATFEDSDAVAIPRADLPFGIPSWHGDGDHATRRGNTIIEWHAAPVG
jgi:uracil-DNA glycosylase